MRRAALVAVVGVLLLALALRAGRIAELGIQADEGAYLVIIEGLLQGKLPYRDLFLNHPPGMFWLLSGVFRLTTSNLFVGRWVTQLVSVLTVAGLIACVKLALPGKNRWWGGVLAGLLFALTPLAIFWSRFIILEHYETLLATLAVALVLLGMRRGDNGRFWLLSGFLTGLAVLVKISGLVLVPVVALSLLIVYWRDWLKLMRIFGLWLLGVAVVLAGGALVLAGQGVLADFGRYFSGADRLAPFTNILGKLASFGDWHSGWLLLMLAAIGTVSILLFRRRVLFVGLVWAVFEVGALFLPERLVFSFGGFSHYAIPAMAALSVLAGSGVVWGWAQTSRSRVWRWGLVGALALCFVLAVWPKWALALDEVVRRSEYPQLVGDELVISEVVRAIAAEDESFLVFGNSGFYHWAERPLITKFYHIPAYFKDATFRYDVETELTKQLADDSFKALLVTGMHMDERIWPELSAVMWDHWELISLFSYPYQEDVGLFLPEKTPQLIEMPIASFGNGFELHQVEVAFLENQALLIDLSWVMTEPNAKEIMFFIHVLDENGNLIAQSDSIPGKISSEDDTIFYRNGRSVTTWPLQEPVSDRRWLWLPEDISPDEIELHIGLYPLDTVERIPLLDNNSEIVGDSYKFLMRDTKER